MGIARPLNNFQLKTADGGEARSAIEPAMVDAGNDAFDQGSTYSFLRSVDEFLYSFPTPEDADLVLSGFSPAQMKLFDQRHDKHTRVRQEIWDGLHRVRRSFRAEAREAQRILENNPNVNPGDIPNYFLSVVVEVLQQARYWHLDASPFFEDD